MKTWTRLLKRWLRPQGIAASPPRRRQRRLMLETLEDRLAPATLTVNTNVDVVNPADGTLSLRDAILAVSAGNTNGLTAGEINNQVSGTFGNDTIQFAASLSGQTITLTSALPALSNNVSIVGPGAMELAISGAGQYPVFDVGSVIAASISALTIVDGYAVNGGGVYNGGTLTVSNCEFYGNSASFGGAIYNNGLLTVTGSTFSYNQVPASGVVINNGAQAGGGAIYNTGTLTVSTSTFSRNSAVSGGCAIWNEGTLTVSNSTFSGNSFEDIRNEGSLTIGNTILGEADVGNFDGPVTSNGYNLIGNPFGYAVPFGSFGAIGDQVGDSPFLSTLADFGGPTQTFGLQNGITPALIGTGGPTTTVAKTINATCTTIPVADAGTIASTPGQYVIAIDTEQMLVTNVNLVNNTLTVQRGYNGTVAVSHNDNAGVYPTTDQRGLPRLVNGNVDIGAVEYENVMGTQNSTVIQEDSVPTPNSVPDVIAAAPDGSIYFSEYNGGNIGQVAPSGAIAEYPADHPTPRWVVTDALGNAWFSAIEQYGFLPTIAEMNSSGVIIAVYTFRTAFGSIHPYGRGIDPALAFDEQGNLWFTEYWSSGIGYINPQTGAVVTFNVPDPTGNIVADNNGNIWFNFSFEGYDGNCLAELDPSTGAVSVYPMPGASPDSHETPLS